VRGTLASKTVVLVTHQVEFLHSADLILVMRDGEIVQSGNYDELVKLGLDFGALIDAHNQTLQMAEAQGLEDEEEIIND
jgi:ATP-binding cassette subfamily C (CFTR/MRP) protein 1